MKRSRNGRNRRHNYFRYVDRSVAEKERRMKAKMIIDKQIFTGEMKKPKVAAKIGNTVVVT